MERWIEIIKAFATKVNSVRDTPSAELKLYSEVIQDTKLLDLEQEDQYFIEEYKKVIDDERVNQTCRARLYPRKRY